MSKVLFSTPVRITAGILVCGSAMLAFNGLLKLLFDSGGDLLRIIRLILSTIVILATYYYFFKFYERRKITELAPDNALRETMTGFAVGTMCMSGVVFLLYLLGYYRILSVNSLSYIVVLFLFFTAAAVLEEIVFRGIVYRILEERGGTYFALIISASIFGVVHAFNTNANVISILSAALGGMILGAMFTLTGRLWLPIAFHAGWNFCQGCYGVAISGIDDVPSFFVARLEGPQLVTGGGFGPENSLVALTVLGVLLAILLHTLRKKGGVVPSSSGQ